MIITVQVGGSLEGRNNGGQDGEICSDLLFALNEMKYKQTAVNNVVITMFICYYKN